MMKLPREDMMNLLWGDCYYNKKKKKTTNKEFNKKGKANKRCFCQFIMDPIIKVHKLANEINEETRPKLEKMLNKINVELTTKEWKLDGRKLSKICMQKWLNASEAILEMVVLYVPSPK